MTKLSYNQIKDRCDRIRDMVRDRARQECLLAGLDPSLLGIHPHNAMVDYDAGRPWRGIDYHHVRRCLWLQDRQFDASRILDRLYTRKGPDAFDWSR